jgi:methionine-rich copper-binding protein CopC
MNYKGIILILVVLVIFLVGAVAYLLMSQPAENATLNVTNNTTTSTDSQQTQDNQSTSVKISSAKAKSIAADYMASNPDQFSNTEAGTPSLKGGIYYVPVVVTKEGQHSVGTVVAYVKVDGETGSVFGIQEIVIY